MDTSKHQATGPAAHAGPTPVDPEHFREHVRRYLYIFYALIFGTAITVGASYIPFGNQHLNVAVALLIAVAKASLVACYFMHLISEKKLIYSVMGFTAFFFIGLMFLTIWAFADFPRHTVTR
jgi:caa(3)-type oxidase subunit IV